jgi:hypothetical protein
VITATRSLALYNEVAFHIFTFTLVVVTLWSLQCYGCSSGKHVVYAVANLLPNAIILAAGAVQADQKVPDHLQEST